MDKKSQKAKSFFKKNVYYIIMAVCLLAIAAMITVTVLINNGTIGGKDVTPADDPAINVNPDDTPTTVPDDTPTTVPDDTPTTGDVTPKPTPIVFVSPVATENVVQNYSMDALVWNSTLKHYAVHNGIDYSGTDGTNVMSAYDGTVTDVSYDILNGYSVTVKHSDTLTTVYSSLNEPVVTVGQAVKQGGVIGTMGVTATAEYTLGAHLHFCAYENGELINPTVYMTATNNK